MVGPRVGVSVEADRPWRFWIGDSPFVSDYKRSPRAPRATSATPMRSDGNPEHGGAPSFASPVTPEHAFRPLRARR